MSIGDFFKGLLLDAWYKAFVYIGGLALVLSFFVDTKGISNTHLQLIAGGVFIVGIGEWKNHKENSWIKPPSAYTGPAALMTQTVWRPDIMGITLDLVGIGLLVTGMYGATRSTIFTDMTSTPTPTIAPVSTPGLTPTFVPITPTTPEATPISLNNNFSESPLCCNLRLSTSQVTPNLARAGLAASVALRSAGGASVGRFSE